MVADERKFPFLRGQAREGGQFNLGPSGILASLPSHQEALKNTGVVFCIESMYFYRDVIGSSPRGQDPGWDAKQKSIIN
jgi:hypothetical protein